MHHRPSLAARLAALLPLLLALLAPVARGQDWGWAEGRPVKGVFWQGLRRVNDNEAQGLVDTRVGESFSSYTLSEDVARLYRAGLFGSPQPDVPPVVVELRPSPDGDGVLVEFRVHERPRVRRVVIEGADALDRDVLAKRVRLEAGGHFDAYSLQRDARSLERALVEEGYLLARVTHHIEPHESGVDVYFQAYAGPEVHVEQIRFEGARQLDPAEILGASGPDAVETKVRELFGWLEKGVYRPEVFDRDLERIARWYRSQGFLDARIYKLAERYDVSGEELTLVVGVEEGPRYTIRRVALEGHEVVSEGRLMAEVPLRPGRPFLGTDLQEALNRVRRLYGRMAYVHARADVELRYDLERHLVDILLRVSEGPRVRLEQVRIEGNEKTREEVIRRELSFYPGEYVDADQIEASVGRLGRLRYFQDLRIDFEPGSEPGLEDLVVRVEEARTGAFVLGGGVSTTTGFFGNISVTQRNFDITDVPRSLRDFIEGRAFTGGGQSLSIAIQPGRERSQYSVEFVEPYLLGWPVPLELEASARDRVREDWLESRRAGRIGLGYRFTQDLVFTTSYRIERVRVADIELDAVPDVIAVAGTNYVSAIRFSIGYDQTLVDRDFVAYGGYALSAYYEVAGGLLGGDHDFQRVGAVATYQRTMLEWPAHHKWVLSFRGDVAYQKEYSDSDDVPIFERFFAGGPGSIRGFRFRTVGPQLRDKPLGGDFLAVGNVEFSFPLFQDILRGVVFVDAGGAFPEPRDFDRHDIRVAAGFGFRIKVPVFPAPVALDFGWPLRKERDDDRQVFSFSVGVGSGF